MVGKKFGVALGLFLLFSTMVSAQIRSGGSGPVAWFASQHGVESIRSVGLGGTGAAHTGDPAAWNSNPATLAAALGAGAHYGAGPLYTDITTGIGNFRSAGAWAAIPYGAVGLEFIEADLGEYQQTFQSGSGGASFRMLDRTMALTAATHILSPVSLGISLKRVEFIMDGRMSDSSLITPTEHDISIDDSGIYLDFGAIISSAGFMRGEKLRDTTHFGIAIQDIGGAFDYNGIRQSNDIVQWLRAGGSYGVEFFGDAETPVFEGALTLEYLRMLNAEDNFGRTEYGGIGLEATILDILSLRAGERFHPDNNGRFHYGAGIRLALSRVGIDIPVMVGADYARGAQRREWPVGDKEPNMFELHAAYTAPIF